MNPLQAAPANPPEKPQGPPALLRALMSRAEEAGSFLEARILGLVAENEPVDRQDLLIALKGLGPPAQAALAGLEARGLVARRKRPEDRRRTCVVLTPAGRLSAGAAESRDPLMSQLSPEELSFLAAVSGKPLGPPRAGARFRTRAPGRSG